MIAVIDKVIPLMYQDLRHSAAPLPTANRAL